MTPKPTTNLLKQLRALMQNPQYVQETLEAYIIPSNDAHNSEYLADCDMFRPFISGFTGSAGTAIVTEKEALLWTDGRYFVQASQQLDSNWTLMKEGIPSTPTQGGWLTKNLPLGSRVGVDPKIYTYHMWMPLQSQLEAAGHKLVPVTKNLVDILWVDRPLRPTNPIHPLGPQFTGKSVSDKLEAVRAQMKDKKAHFLVLTALDEIAWLLNLRGSDIAYNPVFFSYVVVHHNSFTVFLNPKQVSEEIKQHLTKEAGNNKYEIKSYDEIGNYLKVHSSNLEGSAWFSENASFALTSIIPSKSLLAEITPIPLMKAVKNSTEIKGMRNAHIKDGAALCCYFAWLEKHVKEGNITEVSGAKKLDEFRAQQADFVGPSFPTISSVGPHGAIIHYQPEASTDVPITTDTLYLCDSGGQYKDGTTDVTRTFHFGTPTQYEKECFTRVLKGQIKLATSIFPTKIKGNCLDSFAREFLWDVGLDYAHGTGHGIGSYLNVHEGPMGISWRPIADDPGLEANMFLSNEPGYYEDGKFGLRLEDIVQIVEANPPHNFNDRGFLTFDTITFCPKQTKMITVDLLTNKEIAYLNDYHKQCRDLLGPVLETQGHLEAKEWLWKETEPLPTK
ncbi:Peptidase M24 and/or Creatinase N domain containing protein [Asbolus verrucosus]|uniref:Peptidase M24 and/or Creatinase N domain containing protein n=1 Tax=Asbolus verrucosus TaxID=1661398 RepID=A0A482VLB7_ASBVE|nr:Peptidase M24 and/or Creatinase N domain containing protein [Asbolus verrucosus]